MPNHHASRRSVLVTGVTGLLGQRLVWELLCAGQSVRVLVRDKPGLSAGGRIERILDDWQHRTGRQVPRPEVLAGDLRDPRFGLPGGTYARLCRSVGRVVHCAASVAFQPDRFGDPEATNVGGTEQVLRFCRAAGAGELHHVSTAYVCGRREGLVCEHELDVGQEFRNAYEASKLAAEQMVRRAESEGRIKATVYRPSIIVGDSRSGHTSSFHGLYQFFRMGQVLRRIRDERGSGRQAASVRVAADGDQRRNFVPVDYVSEAMIWIFNHPRQHGGTYHLTHPDPPKLSVIKEVIEEYFGIRTFRFVGHRALPLPDANVFEQVFYGETRAYRDYLDGEPCFDRRRVDRALGGSGIRCPALNHARMRVLLDFAVRANWGRNGRVVSGLGEPLDCRDYFERFLPAALPASAVARATAFDVDVMFEISGAGGGRWQCRFRQGRLAECVAGGANGQQVTYSTDVNTFHEVVSGRTPYQQAFLQDRVRIDGDMETGLKLGAIFARFTQECPYRAPTGS